MFAADALSRYAEDVMNTSAGYGVIRHAKFGRYVSDDEETQSVLDELNTDTPRSQPKYEVLRAARAGLLRTQTP